MKATLYNVISADGYIMTKDGDESFIPDSFWLTVLEVFRKCKVFLMGRKTYDAFQNYDKVLLEPFEELDLRKIVVSHNVNFKPKSGYEAVDSPEKVLNQNQDVLVSSGSILNNYLFENNLIDEIILHQLPVSLGDGTKPFDDRFLKNFTPISEEQMGNIKELRYRKVLKMI